MPRPHSRTVFVIVPGGAQNPAHYGYLSHLLMSQGYPVVSSLLPSTGTGGNVTVQDDTDYVRKSLLLPVLDIEKHNVIIVTHSYSGLPGSAAALGLGKSDRAAQGKSTSVLGQIHISAVLTKGGDGTDLFTTFGGQVPPHLSTDEAAGLITCDDPAPPLYQDVKPQALQDAAVLATLCPSLASFKSPCPRASWDSEAYKGRIAYIRTVHDQAVPYPVQDMMIQGTGQEWILRDIESGHSAQLAMPEKMCEILLELAKMFETM